MSVVRGSCLCGDVAWEMSPPFRTMSHCHCARCRKSHGAAFATFLRCNADAFRLVRGRERIVSYVSSPGATRPFCARCGAKVPDGEPWHGTVGVPAGPFDDDPGSRPQAHIFVASKAPWFEIHDTLPRFDTYPPNFNIPAVADRPSADPAGAGIRGSCLCGAVAYVVTGEITICRHCHCSRCRKARGAAHASNLATNADGLHFTRGEDASASYKIPEAKFFTQTFCRTCGSPTPRIDRTRNLGIVPMGSLDDDPRVRPMHHIFVGSKAPWYPIADDLPQFVEYPAS
jgi:hypothetical protein